jgi:phenylacetate-CoA ligase
VAYYSGYASALYLLAVYLMENGIRLRNPPRITCSGAETLLPHQRRVIEQALQTEVADQYGTSEACVNISECQKHAYHQDMEFGIIELLPLDGAPKELRRIVCTGFCNPVMPFIRFNIGDLATVSERSCTCGRRSPTVERIDGRIESYVITPDGRQLGRLDFLFKETHRIREAQLVQDELDHVTVRIVQGPGYGPQDEEHLLHDMRQYMGSRMRIGTEYLPEIPRELNGKFRQIVSRVYQDKYGPAPGGAASAPPACHSVTEGTGHS